MTEREMLIQRLNLYQKAERDVTLHGQTVELEGMRITRASLEDLRKEIRNLKQELSLMDKQEAQRKRSRIRAIIPL
ncbi:MAG: hypothetical protein IJR85_04655 [Synergistaceae bacterium]|nr:hypothetical protein [Synergistaceae bacterium]